MSILFYTTENNALVEINALEKCDYFHLFHFIYNKFSLFYIYIILNYSR